MRVRVRVSDRELQSWLSQLEYPAGEPMFRPTGEQDVFESTGVGPRELQQFVLSLPSWLEWRCENWGGVSDFSLEVFPEEVELAMLRTFPVDGRDSRSGDVHHTELGRMVY